MRTVKLILFLLLSTSAWCQDPQTNQEKYWKYKERLKNYVVVGDCQGCSLPVGGRGGFSTTDPEMAWHDEPGEMGYYISNLAMEYKLRIDHGLPLDGIDRELFYAIDALNRLDLYAESYWDFYWNGISRSPNPADLNGFLIRDDVPAQFFDGLANGNLIENQFNHSLFPPLDNYRAVDAGSGFTRGPAVVASCLTNTPGPEEMSQDHFISVLAGLALVVKLVPPGDTYQGNTFLDQQSTTFVQAAKRIAERVTLYAQSENWVYRNPITGIQVQGIEWDDCHQNQPGIGGGYMQVLSYGFAWNTSLIVNDFDWIASLSYFAQHFSSDASINLSMAEFQFWEGTPPENGNEDFKVLMLAATGNIWGSNTPQVLGARFDREFQDDGDEVHIPQAVLVNSILFGNTSAVPNSVWECMLNSAPCTDMNANNHNFEWGHGHGKFLYGPNVPQYYYSDQLSGLPYLYFFNAYNIYNGSYLGNSYQPIAPFVLLNTHLVLSYNANGYVEHDEKNFYSAQTIVTQNSYRIENDGNAAQSYASPLDEANVTFAAGQSIILNPGFQVIAGANFRAVIDPSLGAISCEGENNSAVCSNCKVGVGEEKDQLDLASGNKLIIIPCGESQLFIGYDHHLFKVETRYASGSTMFGIGEADDCINFPCRSGCSGDSRYNVIGYHNFNVGSNIVDIVFTGTETFVALTGPTQNHEGRIVKFSGNGGEGSDMIGMSEDAFGILTAVGNSYLVGTQYFFAKDIRNMKLIANDLFVIFKKEMIKIGSGMLQSASGLDMFDVTTSINTGEFVWGTTSTASCGDQVFDGVATEITELAYIYPYMFVCSKVGVFEHGKILKVNGTGGTGHNMFGVDDSPQSNNDAYDPLPQSIHYVGDDFINTSYQSYVTKISTIASEMFVAFRNGRMMKIQDDGGSGHHMFNVIETTGGFDRYSLATPNYLIGSQDFENGVYVTDIDYFSGTTFISCFDGKILKVNSTGGTGINMFNVDANSGYGFTTTSSVFPPQMQGCTDFRMTVTSMEIFEGQMYIALDPGVLICVNGSGSGNNMFGLAYQKRNSFKAQCGYFYFVGCEDFSDLCNEDGAGNRILSQETVENATIDNSCLVYPNPTNGLFTVRFTESNQEELSIEVLDATGNKLQADWSTTNEKEMEVNLTELPDGIYLIRIFNGSNEYVNRIVLFTAK